ncbi:hypothetical protein IHC87_17400 [Photobacterium damselae subsp. damselae]|uniref:hypothetical protein n=1 Tax=Photobacterium damselae TaxID=38293 RepID=UPI001F17FCCD|nr:hypothetical protein [Photobacterium damselae]UJZ96344.1 hypothetical protein IHC87_17400 [Photobacterium damselae subsp. damselae]UJZ99751.1 hypothetical protein IHC88_20090 [Photobacterium damselae subsp. damselae]
MVPVSDFLPALRMMVDVPIPGVMERALLQAAIRFCRESQCLFYSRSFDEVYEHQQVSAIGDQLSDKGKAQLKGAGVVFILSQGVELAKGRAYEVKGLNDIIFKRDLIDVTIEAFAEPTLTANQLPSMLYQDYLNTLCAGAASLLQMQPNQSWTQPDLAQYNEHLFVTGYREAFRQAIEQREYRPRPVARREFF